MSKETENHLNDEANVNDNNPREAYNESSSSSSYQTTDKGLYPLTWLLASTEVDDTLQRSTHVMIVLMGTLLLL